MKNILILPGWMTSLKFYNGHSDFDVRIGRIDDAATSADYIIGLSLGTLEILKYSGPIKGKIILVNPPLPKRNILVWFVKLVDYITHEGLFIQRQKFTINPFRFGKEIFNCVRLLNMDFSETLDKIPKDKLTIIRSTNDKFFCDKNAVEFIRSKNITILEIEGTHNWCQEIETTINNLTAY